VLNRHLIELERFEEFNYLTYGLPREGYRGCAPRPDNEVLEIRDPLRELMATIDIRHGCGCKLCQLVAEAAPDT
jgi:hypothetical protein